MSTYANFHIVRNFNSETPEIAMENFCYMYHQHNLIKWRLLS